MCSLRTRQCVAEYYVNLIFFSDLIKSMIHHYTFLKVLWVTEPVKKKLYFWISRNLNGLKTTIWFTYPLRIHSMFFFVEDECFAGWVTVAVFWSRNLYQFFDEFFFGTKIKQFQSLKYGTALHEVLLCTVANVVYHRMILSCGESIKRTKFFPGVLQTWYFF